jgi:integrase
MFAKFTAYTGKTADELIQQRNRDVTSPDRKQQRAMESQLTQFLAAHRTTYKTGTLQNIFAAVRSFFEIHYQPLKMRRGDYPTGESLGQRIATKDAILKAIECPKNQHTVIIKAAILLLKDSGLRTSDVISMKYGDIREPLERGDKIIPLTKITQKQRTIAKTFLGEEAVEAIKLYLNLRRTGTRHMEPETLTDASPLFRKWHHGTAKPEKRSSFGTLIGKAFKRIGETNMSAHSLRKYLQTNLEAAGMNVNWIDQILGHKLINSRDAYSKPTDEQLKEAYTKAYKFLRVYPDLETPTQPTQTDEQQTNDTTEEEYIVKTAQNLEEAIRLVKDGYQHAATIEGTQLYKKRK